jgi:hypothetical protein
MLFSILYRSDSPLVPARLQPNRFRIPASIYSLLSRILSPVFASSPPPPPRRGDRILPPEFTDRRPPIVTDRAVAELLARGMFGGSSVPPVQPAARRGNPPTVPSARGAGTGMSPSGLLASRLGVPLAAARGAAAAVGGETTEAQEPSETSPRSPEASRRAFGLPVGAWVDSMTGSGGNTQDGDAGTSNTVRAPSETEMEA